MGTRTCVRVCAATRDLTTCSLGVTGGRRHVGNISVCTYVAVRHSEGAGK